jgi:hypothetical protein
MVCREAPEPLSGPMKCVEVFGGWGVAPLYALARWLASAFVADVRAWSREGCLCDNLLRHERSSNRGVNLGAVGGGCIVHDMRGGGE